MRFLLLSLVAIVFASVSHAHDGPVIDIDGVAIPADIELVPTAVFEDRQAADFSGVWIGKWDGILKHIMIVNEVRDDGTVQVVYSFGDHPAGRFKADLQHLEGRLSGNSITVNNNGRDITYELSRTGRLRATFGNGLGFAVLRRTSFKSAIQNAATTKWDDSTSIMLDTSLGDAGSTLKLETVLYEPDGKGAFPLAIINHGSTGNNVKAGAKYTFSNPWLADLLNERGWIVAFPQRRGRGKSQGTYSEGITKTEPQTYSCEIEDSLAGADRALEDIEASVAALKSMPKISDSPIFISGHSRGGALAVAYAGKHPKDTTGVVNFVGGWMGDKCENSEKINQTLFNRGASFPGSTLWVYGADDAYYSMQHIKKNHSAFSAAGGDAKLVEVTVNGKGNGHFAMLIPPLWQAEFLDYIDNIKN